MPTASSGNVSDPTAEYLSDLSYRFLHTQQGWGDLGLDSMTTAWQVPKTPICIGEKEYAKGLGSHAPSEIVVDLNGDYDLFEAEVGVQKQDGWPGSVEFKVYVDDALKYESGVMRGQDAAQSVKVPVDGASELRLVITDAGDGMQSDNANWAAARLVPSRKPHIANPQPRFDAAPFARVVASDPKRMDGSRANRIEEYQAGDVYMATEILPEKNGYYTISSTESAPGCIGLQWFEKRSVRRLVLEYAPDSPVPDVNHVQLHYWTGESAWQGKWVALEGGLVQEGRKLVFQPAREAHFEDAQGTRKVRWIFPPSARPIVIAGFSAETVTATHEVDLALEREKSAPGGRVPVDLYNGEFVEPANAKGKSHLDWDGASILKVRVLNNRLKYNKAERTVLRFNPGGAALGVGVDDVLEKGCVYVPSAGLFVRRMPDGPSLAEYRKQIAGRKTVLEEVRSLPDQTLDQAMSRAHNRKQNTGPVMVSLACDNRKFVLEEDGALRFSNHADGPEFMAYYPLRNSAEVRPMFGSGNITGRRRYLNGQWLPCIVQEVMEGQLIYRQRLFVAPLDDAPAGDSLAIHRQAIGVMEFEFQNPTTNTQPVSLALSFLADAAENAAASVEVKGQSVIIRKGDHLLAFVDLRHDEFRAEAEGGRVTLTGSAPGIRTTRLIVLLPGWEAKPEEMAALPAVDELFGRMKAHWERVMSPSMGIKVPDTLLMDVIRASQVHCLIAARNEENGARIAPWIASMSYGPLESEAHSIVRGMDFLGYHGFARRSLDFYVHRYNDQGFLTTGYTLMGTGWHLWSLGEHYQLTQNAGWIKTVAPRVRRVCEWISTQREKTKGVDPQGELMPESGLMPPGVMADWNAFAYHFCLSGYYYAGLDRAGRALQSCGDPSAAGLLKSASDFRSDILRAYRWTQARMPVYELRNGEWVPGYPSQLHSPGPTNHFFPGQDANRSWCYDVELGAHQLVPQGILEPDSPETAWMMDHMEDVQFLADGWFDFESRRNHEDWFNLGGFSKVQPYYCRNAEIYAMRDDVKPFVRSYFNALASLLNTEVLCLWEHFNGAGAWNKTHETGYFLHQTRLMLVTERGKELWLAPMTPAAWFADGKVIEVTNAPTVFGPVSYRIASHVAENAIEAEIQSPVRETPEAVFIRLRHPEGKPMKSVTVNGKAHEDFDAGRECVRIMPKAGTNQVRAIY